MKNDSLHDFTHPPCNESPGKARRAKRRNGDRKGTGKHRLDIRRRPNRRQMALSLHQTATWVRRVAMVVSGVGQFKMSVPYPTQAHPLAAGGWVLCGERKRGKLRFRFKNRTRGPVDVSEKEPDPVPPGHKHFLVAHGTITLVCALTPG